MAVDVMAIADAPQMAEPMEVSQLVFFGSFRSLPRNSATARIQMVQRRLLRFPQVVQYGARGADCRRVGFRPAESLERLGPEMLGQSFTGAVARKGPTGPLCEHEGLCNLVGQRLRIFAHQTLRRLDAG